jgi:hypothetical protein
MSQQSAGADSDQGKAQPPRRFLMPAAVALVGGALTVGALMLASNSRSDIASAPGASDLGTVAVADIAAATPTIIPAVAAELAAQAKDCRVPLARVTLSKVPGTAGGTMQLRSGSYLSPPIQLTDAPQQVAIPFPAPYSTGGGVLGVVGSASGVAISLYPTWTVQTLTGAANHNVVWNPNKPCG